MSARDVMTTEVVSVGPQTTVREIASLLIQRRISAVPVLEGGRLIGIVSEGDLMRRPETDTDSGASPWLSLFAGPGVAPDRFAKVHGMTAREARRRHHRSRRAARRGGQAAREPADQTGAGR